MADVSSIIENMGFNASDPFSFPTCCAIYDQPRAIKSFVQIYRFGYTNQIGALFSDDKEEQTGYIIGLVIIPIIIGIIFAIWSLVLCIFPCLGQKRVGFWSGSNLEVSEKKNRPRNVRIVFLFSALVLFAAVAVSVELGIKNLQYTTDSFSLVAESVQSVAEETSKDTIAMEQHTGKARTTLQSIENQLDDFCADKPAISLAAKSFSGEFQVNSILDEVTNGLTNLDNALKKVNDSTEKAQSTIKEVDVYFKYIKYYFIPLVVLAAILFINVLLVSFGYNFKWWICVQRYFFMPLFIIWVTLSWILSLIFFVVALMNSDACSGGSPPSPSGTALQALKMKGYSPESLATDKALAFYMIEYYLGCGIEFPVGWMAQYRNYTNDLSLSGSNAIAAITGAIDYADLSDLNLGNRRLQDLPDFQNVTDSLQDLPDFQIVTDYLNVEAVCGPDAAKTFQAIQALVDVIASVISTILDLLNNFSCERISPIFHQTFNEAICTHIPSAFFWFMGSLLCISASGLIMVSLRSATLPVRDPTQYSPTDDSFQKGVGQEVELEEARAPAPQAQELSAPQPHETGKDGGSRVIDLQSMMKGEVLSVDSTEEPNTIPATIH